MSSLEAQTDREWVLSLFLTTRQVHIHPSTPVEMRRAIAGVCQIGLARMNPDQTILRPTLAGLEVARGFQPNQQEASA